MSQERLEELARSADQLTEQLTDAALDLLHSAMEQPSAHAAALVARRERLVTRARGSLERASRLLREAAGVEVD